MLYYSIDQKHCYKIEISLEHPGTHKLKTIEKPRTKGRHGKKPEAHGHGVWKRDER